MRINPISAASCNLQTKKINFGMIDNERTEKLTWDKMMEECHLFYWDEEDRQDPNSGYKEAVEDLRKRMDYFKTSRLFTLKSKKDIKNKDVLYVLMHKSETDKHEHKEMFDEMIDRFKILYDPSNEKCSVMCTSAGQRAGLPGDEQEFFDILDGGSEINTFYNIMQNNEQGIVPPPPEPPTHSEPLSEPVDLLADDKAYQAYILYGP